MCGLDAAPTAEQPASTNAPLNACRMLNTGKGHVVMMSELERKPADNRKLAIEEEEKISQEEFDEMGLMETMIPLLYMRLRNSRLCIRLKNPRTRRTRNPILCLRLATRLLAHNFYQVTV